MSIKTMNSTPAADGFTMPAEWAHQQAVWMIWPFRPDNWREARSLRPDHLRQGGGCHRWRDAGLYGGAGPVYGTGPWHHARPRYPGGDGQR